MVRAIAAAGWVAMMAAGLAADEDITVRLTPAGGVLVIEADNGKEVVAWVGRALEVRLEGDRPQTGWEGGEADGAIQHAGFEFKPKPGAADKAIGTYTFRYNAVKEGVAALRMVHVFPGGPEPTLRTATELVKEFKVTVRVRPALATPAAKEGERASPLPDNATAKFLGPEGDWPKCQLVLRDVHPLFGGQDVYVGGSGECIIRVVAGKEKRFRLKLTAADTLALRRACIEADLADLKIKDRLGAADEPCPELSLTNAAGGTRKVAKLFSDKVPAFDKVHQAVRALTEKTKDLKPEYEGPYDRAWKPGAGK
jgi:hypothetical protein